MHVCMLLIEAINSPDSYVLRQQVGCRANRSDIELLPATIHGFENPRSTQESKYSFSSDDSHKHDTR